MYCETHSFIRFVNCFVVASLKAIAKRVEFVRLNKTKNEGSTALNYFD